MAVEIHKLSLKFNLPDKNIDAQNQNFSVGQPRESPQKNDAGGQQDDITADIVEQVLAILAQKNER